MSYMTKKTTPAKSKSKSKIAKANLSQGQGNAACFTWLSSIFKKKKESGLSDTYSSGRMEFQPPMHQRGRRTALGAGSNSTQVHTDLAVSLSDLSHLAMVEDEAFDDINTAKMALLSITLIQEKITCYLLWTGNFIIRINR
ncbi:hypothetical protein PTT73_17505 [Serratia ureilytica]|uniref:hypothetical protein n=1 Tax=Serratia ureilytica TaxID=300181 RepID=UPI00313DA4FC